MRFDPVNPTLDFNGDNRADIYWRNDSANLNAVWMMNGIVPSSSFLPDVPEEAGWRAPTFGDFDGNGKTDFLWHNTTTGANAIWLMDGGRVASAYFVGSTSNDWEYKIADFNGDGTSDIFWHNQTNGSVATWTFRNGSISDAQFIATVPPEWDAYIADVNGDRKSDLFWRNSRTGDNAAWTMNNNTVTQAVFVKAEAIGWAPTIADLNGDGKTDVFWHNPNGQNKATLWSNTSVANQTQIALPSTILDIGSADADVQFVIADVGAQNAILAFDPLYNTLAGWAINGQTLVTIPQQALGGSTYGVTLKVADFDGDGTADLFTVDRFSGDIGIGTSSRNYDDATVANLPSSSGWKARLS
jgi:hypothetical protein